MATAKRKTGKRSRWTYALVLLALILAAAAFAYREPIKGYTYVSAAYSARVACSCRFVGGRDLEDCAKDKLEGMELVSLSEDAEAKTVTARFPLLASETAQFRDGYGCVLQEWEG